MATRFYRNREPQRRIDGSDIFRQRSSTWPQSGHVIEQLHMAQTYPALRERVKTAMGGEYMWTQYYQRLQAGRRCSCWGATVGATENTASSKNCRVCFGTGIVGGYLKYGTAEFVVDATSPGLQLINVQPNVASEGPVVFGLVDGAEYGEIIAPGDLQGCAGPLDNIDCLQWDEEGGNISWYIRTPAAPDWIPLTEITVPQLLSQPQRFDVRATLKRPSIGAATPLVAKCAIRIKRTPDSVTQVRINRPRLTQNLTLAELGVTDDWATQRWWLDSTLPSVSDQDWFWEVERNLRWKIVDTDRMAPQNYLLGWDCTLRKIQAWEAMSRFPL